VFSRPVSGTTTFFEYLSAGPGEFVVSTAEGGTDDANNPVARRIRAASDGTLTIQLGKSGESGWSSLAYVEIFRASSAHPAGDDGTDSARVQRRGIHHAKFFVFDHKRLWCGSHNITPVDPACPPVRSEDAILTDEPGVVKAFVNEFNRWWGAGAGAPDPAVARTLVFKTPTPTEHLVPGVHLPGIYSWKVRFSPSTTVSPGIDLFKVIDDHLASATQDVLVLMEQITEGGDFDGFAGPNDVIARLKGLGSAGLQVHGVVGNEVFPSSLAGPGLDIERAEDIHNKAVLVDTLRDNETLRQGRVLCGSMNISQSAMHTSHEQTLVIADPAIANQYLQCAAGFFADHGNALARKVDVVIVVDRSGSMNSVLPDGVTKMEAARAAAGVFLSLLDLEGNHRVGIVPFGAAVDTMAERALGPLDSSTTAAFGSAIAAINTGGTIGGATCYGLALTAAWEQLTAVAEPASRRLVVFLSDGKQNRAPWAIERYPTLVANNVEIHTTAFGDLSTSPEGANAVLHDMATASGATFAQVDNDDIHLRKRFADVARDAQDLTTILESSWEVTPGLVTKQTFPSDLPQGRLVIAWLWSSHGGGLSTVTLRTASGRTLTRNSPGVRVRRGAGHEVWHVDINRVGRDDEVLGEWAATVQANYLERARFRLDMCVYATETGLARIQAEIANLEGSTRELRVRVWDGRLLAKGVRVSTMHAPPGPLPLQARSEPIALKDLSAGRRAWRGVRGVQLPATPGPHAVHIVVEGVARAKLTDGVNREVPFRRELTRHWHASIPVLLKPHIDFVALRKRRIR
jgi:Mg-chelatase subunit ChlD